eukprot:5298554-Ditylum_brightwellii.AAC.1
MQQAVQAVDDAFATTVHATKCANLEQCEWNYAVGQEVLTKSVNPSKLEPRAHDPYVITQVFTYGTVK